MKRYGRVRDGLTIGRLPGLLLLSGCFALGVVLGCALASYLEDDPGGQLLSYLDGYLLLLRDEGAQMPSLLSVFWETVRWPVIAGVLGLTLLGMVAVPVIFALRGFLLSYTVSIFIRLLGLKGLTFAGILFGLPAALSVTALFLVGLDAFACGRLLNGAARQERKELVLAQQNLIRRMLGAVCWLAAGAAAQYWLSPILLRAVAVLF